MKNKRLTTLVTSAFLICVLVCIIAYFMLEDKIEDTNTFAVSSESKNTTINNVETTIATTNNSFNITLTFVGDCLCATDENTSYVNCFNDVAKSKKRNYFLRKVSPFFLNDDFTMADCENVYSDNNNLNVSDKGQYSDPNIEAYWFKSPAKNANILKVGGIDGVSIANNHINDYGTEGHINTQSALDAANVKWGEEGSNIYFEKYGYKIAIICATMYNSYAVDSIKKSLKKASKESNYQILYFHGGEEAVHKPEDWKIQACHDLVDSGFDLIMGDHPHVLQPMDIYNDVTIIYSLGNFIFGGNRHPENRTIIYQHTLTITDNLLENQSGIVTPCYVYTGDTNNWQPDIITNKAHKNKVLNFMNSKTDSPL